MTAEPTPETDALEDSLVAQDKQYPAAENSAFVKHCVEQLMAKCRALEIQRNAARAERDELNRQLSVALKGKRPYSAEFADETIAAQVKRIAELEQKLNGWFSERDALRAAVARLREAIVQSIAEGGNELPEWVEAKLEKALATLAK
jgi:uncharacterized coiled-coil DUF342 family protein